MSYFFPEDDVEQETKQELPASEPSELHVVRSEHRDRLEFTDGVTWENLLPQPEPDMEWVLINYPPGAPEPPPLLRHGGKDYGMVIVGKLTVTLGFEEYGLQSGDSIAFDATTPHQISNQTTEPASAVWLIRNRHRAPDRGSPVTGEAVASSAHS
ncbi:MAG: cupin domain-containing protein [Acidimicrobiia bacterium]|nr:cupin domain-containing protein [Acidimicrobiia bacterium]